MYGKHMIYMHIHNFFYVEEFYFRIKFLATEILHMVNIWATALCTIYNMYFMYEILVHVNKKKNL